MPTTLWALCVWVCVWLDLQGPVAPSGFTYVKSSMPGIASEVGVWKRRGGRNAERVEVGCFHWFTAAI